MTQTVNDFVNDADYPITTGPLGKRVICHYYQVWANMKTRCTGVEFKEKFKGYANVQCCADWLYFSKFRAWMVTQNWEGLYLDKDLLVAGNKIYSPETCRFVPQKVNSALAVKVTRGKYPCGVVKKSRGKDMINDLKKNFSAYILDINSKKTYVGTFETPEEAHKGWQRAKADKLHELVIWWRTDSSVSSSFDEEIASALYVRADLLRKQAELGEETVFLP